MSTKTHHFRIGLFVLAGAVLFIGALFAMGLKSYFGKRDVYETCVTGKVENLSVGALVKLRGVTIGRVSAIEFAGKEYPGFKDRYVIIQFEVPTNEAWSADGGHIQQTLDEEAARGLRARVQGQGFLGASIVSLEYVDTNLYPIKPIPFTPKHYYIPSAPNQFDRVITSLEKTLRQTEDLDLAGLLDKASRLIDTANGLAGKISQVDFTRIGTNADSLLTNANALVVQFHETNRGLQRTLADAQNAINGADTPGLSSNTVALEARLSAAALDLRHTLDGVDVGALNDSLANIRAATEELIVLLHKLEERPSSVLFSRPPEPASEMEKPPRK